jgi:hypothetical protein
MQTVLTALVAILVFGLLFVVGKIILRGAFGYALELKRVIATIARDMELYADTVLQCEPEEQQAWRAKFRKHACSLREKVAFISWYQIFQTIFRLPSKDAVLEASHQLMRHSDHRAESSAEHLPDETIKELLGIKTPPQRAADRVHGKELPVWGTTKRLPYRDSN